MNTSFSATDEAEERNPTAFDRIAERYDCDFTDTLLGRILRNIVRSHLADLAQPGALVLEIGCGTGEDAVWLAAWGAHVLATDVSEAMLAVTRRKAARAAVTDGVETIVLDAAAPARLELQVDAAFSNFGALNCVADLHPIAEALAGWVKPGGRIVLVFINRWCAWEIVWHLLHLQPQVAFRRLRQGGVQARVGNGVVHTHYPSIGSIRRVFEPSFRFLRLTGLGGFLPPSYLEPFVVRHPRLFRVLSRLERPTASICPFARLSDHVILEFRRAGR